MDFSDLFEGWDFSQFLGVEALVDFNFNQPPTANATSPSPETCTLPLAIESARQDARFEEVQLSTASSPSISSLAGLSHNTVSYFDQPRQPSFRPPLPSISPQDPRLRTRPHFGHAQPLLPPPRPSQICPAQPRPPSMAPSTFRPPPPPTSNANAQSRFAAPPPVRAFFGPRLGPMSTQPFRTVQAARHSTPLTSTAQVALPASYLSSAARPCLTAFPIVPRSPAQAPRSSPNPVAVPFPTAHPASSPGPLPFTARSGPTPLLASQRLSLADYRREKNLLQPPAVSSTPDRSEGSRQSAPKRSSVEHEEGEVDSNGSDESDHDGEGKASNVPKEIVEQRTKEKRCTTKQGLIKRGLSAHFMPLPDGWVEIQHQSGMPVYYEKSTKSLTWSRPYSCYKQEIVRAHKAPISAFPCWEYRRALDEQMESLPEPLSSAEKGVTGDEMFAEILSDLDFKEKSMMSAEQIHSHCSQRFQFNTVPTDSKKSPAAKRSRRDALCRELDDRDGTAVITQGLIVAFRRPNADGCGHTHFVLKASNRNPVALLHDYIHRSGNDQHIAYECRPSLDSNQIHQTLVLLDGKVEGTAEGMSKKASKHAAALDALRKLVPELHDALGESLRVAKKDASVDEVKIFRDIAISDERIVDMALKAGVVPPYQVLLRAVDNIDHDNVSLGGKTKVCFSSRQIRPGQNKYSCTAGLYSASVQLHSALKAKHLCAQQILQQIHPELRTYGEFLELYGSAFRERKQRLMEDANCLFQLPPGPVEDKIDWPRLRLLQEEMQKLIPEVPGTLSSIRYV